jgi:hypothetical protein
LAQYGSLYRALSLPTVSTMAGRRLRALDVQGSLGDAALVVGTTTMAAYQLEAGSAFQPDLMPRKIST